MTSEIAAAAERISTKQPGDEYFWSHGGIGTKYLDDLKLIARAYIAEHPADDAEPITEDWLCSSGFYPAESYGGDGETWNKNIGGSDDDTICFNLTTMKSELWIGSRYISIPGSTRADVRALLRALKITLTEHGTECGANSIRIASASEGEMP